MSSFRTSKPKLFLKKSAKILGNRLTDKDDEENATAPLLTLFGCKKGSEQIGAVCGGAQTMINICKNSSLYNAYCSPQTHIIVWHEHQYWCKPSILNFTCLDHRKKLKTGNKSKRLKMKNFLLTACFALKQDLLSWTFYRQKAMQ